MEFRKKVDEIMKDKTFMKGYQDVEILRSKNPNSTSMFRQDFHQKIVNIENHLESHLQAVGEQVLSSDKEKFDEYEKSKIYNPHASLKFGGKNQP
jgi:hypothetical protein